MSAWWKSTVNESSAAFADAYRRYLCEARPLRAATAAMVLAAQNMACGCKATASSWLSRADRLLCAEPECAERGYLAYLEAVGEIGCRDLGAALAHAKRTQEIGRRFADPNLLALGRVTEGHVRVMGGDGRGGTPLLDEAMLSAVTEDLYPRVAGAVYCHLMYACHELADLRRAAEWTQAVHQWPDRFPGTILRTGTCRIARAWLLRMQGRLEQAEQEAALAAADSAHGDTGVAGRAHDEIGEVHRLRGDFGAAEESFRRARELGCDAQPGLALLLLDQGHLAAATASIRAALLAEDRTDGPARAHLRVAQVEIALAVGDLDTARAAYDDLRSIATASGSSALEAEARRSQGAILLAAGESDEAVGVLRTAGKLWQMLGAVHGACRTRMLLALAYRAVGDEKAAALEFDAAAAGFDQLGASLDARRLNRLRNGMPPLPGLTEREAEVLTHVAAGVSNRQVATTLGLSEKTIARHLSNIFTKLNVSSRTAAAGYAFKHGLLAQPHRGL